MQHKPLQSSHYKHEEFMSTEHAEEITAATMDKDHFTLNSILLVWKSKQFFRAGFYLQALNENKQNIFLPNFQLYFEWNGPLEGNINCKF